MKNLPIYNVLAFVFAIIMNTLANTLPLNGYDTGQLSDMYPNSFVPAGFTFSIWGVIYLLLLVWLIYFLFPRDKKSGEYESYAIGYWFILSCIFNGLWILAWHYLYIGLSVIIMIGIFISLVKMYVALKDRDAPFIVRIPISVYLGWISVALIANITTLLVSHGITLEAQSAIIASVMMIIAVVLGLYFIGVQKDVFYGGVIIWALFGIMSRHQALIIDNTALVGMAVLALLGLVTIFTRKVYTA